MEDIDIIKTKDKHRLIYKTHYLELYEIFALFMILAILIFITVLTFISSQNIYSIIVGSTIFFIFLSFMIFKNKKCRQLLIKQTELTKAENKNLIYKIARTGGYRIHFKNEDYLRAISRFNVFLVRKELTIIFQEKKILINLSLSTGFMRFPSYLGLRKLMNAINASTQQTV